MLTMQFVISAFIMLFVIIEPLGIVPIFASLTSRKSAALKRSIAIKAPLIAFCILFFFAMCGKPFLEAVGISLPAFKIAGGLMLFIIATRMLFTNNLTGNHEKEDEVLKDNVSVFPLAIPLLAGPGSITATILLIGEQSSVLNVVVVIAIIAVLLVLTSILCLLTNKLVRFFNEAVNNIISRLFGIILGALSVQFIIDGIEEVIKALS